MKKVKTKIPDNTTLQLNREQWLAVKGILENFLDSNDAPFLDFYGNEVLNAMGGFSGLAFGEFEKFPEYKKFYKSTKECDGCQKIFFDLKKVDEEELCPQCVEDRTGWAEQD